MFSESDARNAASILKIEFINFTFDDFWFGMNEELEHGTNYPETNVTNDSPLISAKIALAHLNMYPNYYNKEYGLPHFEKTLQLKLAEEQNLIMPEKDDIENKEC